MVSRGISPEGRLSRIRAVIRRGAGLQASRTVRLRLPQSGTL